MLRRAKRLQSVFDEFCTKYGHSHLKLDQEQWRQIDYLLYITQPFFQFTNALSKTKDVTIHLIFGIYNKLFDHLEKSINQLRYKKVPWKKMMLNALYVAKTKLSQYYSKTDGVPGDLFAIGTMLAPQNKLQFFLGKDWGDEWRDRYRQSFVDYFESYKQRLLQNQTLLESHISTTQTSEFDLERMLRESESQQTSLTERDELSRYLESGQYYLGLLCVLLINIRYYHWSNHSSVLERPST